MKSETGSQLAGDADDNAQGSQEAKTWRFCLYVAGMTPTDRLAIRNIKAILNTHLEHQHELEIVDITEDRERAIQDKIIAVPAVVRTAPLPERRVVGDMSVTSWVIDGLELALETSDHNPLA